MGKTETIKKRSIYVYLNSLDQKQRWQEYAKKQGTSISKFVVERVENALSQDEDDSYKSRGELWGEIKELKEQLDKVGREKRVLEIALDRLEEELRRYRAQPFLDEDFTGVRHYQKGLIDILKEGGHRDNEEILSRLGIRVSEQEAVKAVAKQLENLEAYGLVRSTPRGWVWVK